MTRCHTSLPSLLLLLPAVAAGQDLDPLPDRLPAPARAAPPAQTPAASRGLRTTAKIVAPWEGKGHVYQIGPETLLFLGAYEGVMYIETERQDLLDLAIFTCPARTEIRQFDDELHAEGSCTLTSSDGELAFARFTCDGGRELCRGEFVFTGGMGRLEGIEGRSELIIRTAVSSMVENQETGNLISAVEGLALWPRLEMHLPNWPDEGVPNNGGEPDEAPADSGDPGGAGAAPLTLDPMEQAS